MAYEQLSKEALIEALRNRNVQCDLQAEEIQSLSQRCSKMDADLTRVMKQQNVCKHDIASLTLERDAARAQVRELEGQLRESRGSEEELRRALWACPVETPKRIADLNRVELILELMKALDCNKKQHETFLDQNNTINKLTSELALRGEVVEELSPPPTYGWTLVRKPAPAVPSTATGSFEWDEQAKKWRPNIDAKITNKVPADPGLVQLNLTAPMALAAATTLTSWLSNTASDPMRRELKQWMQEIENTLKEFKQ